MMTRANTLTLAAMVSPERVRRIVLAVGLLTLAMPVLPAGGAPSSNSGFTGVWVHTETAEEAKHRKRSIEAATDELSFFVRGKARDRLTQRMAPPRELKLEVEGEGFAFEQNGSRVSLRLGAKPITVERDGKRGALSVRRKGQRMVVTSEGENGRRVTEYEVSRDGKQLTMHVQMTSEKLASPIVFRSTYRKKP